MTRTELWDSPCSMLICSKRSTQLQICGRDSSDVRLGAGERLVGMESGPGAVGDGSLIPHAASAKMIQSPKMSGKVRLSSFFISELHIYLHSITKPARFIQLIIGFTTPLARGFCTPVMT